MNKHRAWLTVEAAAGYLAEKLSEPFTPADIYLQAIEGNLTLSLNLLEYVAVCKVILRPGRIEENIISVSSYTDGRPPKYRGKFSRADKIVEFAHVQENSFQFIRDVHDVLPKGLVLTALKRLLCQNLGMPLSNLAPEHFLGCIFDAGEQGLFQLRRLGHLDAEVESLWQSARKKGVPDDVIRPAIERFERQHRAQDTTSGDSHFYFTAKQIPENAFFVVKVSALDDYLTSENANNSVSDESDLSPRTRNMLIDLLYEVLADRFGEEVANNPRKHFDDADGSVRIMLDLRGAHVPSGQAIARQLKKVKWQQEIGRAFSRRVCKGR